MSDFTNYVDPLDNRDIINDAEWLEAAIIALDLDDPAIAAAEQQLPGMEGHEDAPRYATRGDVSLSTRVYFGYGPCNGSPTAPQSERDATCNQSDSTVDDIAGVPGWAALVNGSPLLFLGEHYDEANSADPLQRHAPAPINANAITTAVANAAAVIVCHNITDIPRGRQQAKILACGLAGCVSAARSDRPHELERHMALYFPGNYPCLQPGCGFTGVRAFKRADKLRKHEREAHGL